MPDARDRTMGLWMAVALVMGNMIGSGVFLLPASLAPYGAISLGGWAVSAGGSVCLALVFARLARLSPESGGPYAYTRRAFGDLAGFLVAWGYWISVWTANAALATAFVGYLDPFFPTVSRTPALASLVAVSMVWVFTAVNLSGVRAAGRVQVVTTLVKVVPLIVIGLAGLAHFVPAHLAVTDAAAHAAAQAGAPGPLLATVTLTLFAFLGLECATIPADNVRDPRRIIPRATVIGTLAAAAIYVISTAGVMGSLPPAVLADSKAPFADAARLMFGDTAARVVAAGAAISCLGALNGWILVVGQLPLAIARDGLFPGIFKRVSRAGIPSQGLVIGGILSSVLVAMNYSHALVDTFNRIILLSTLATLVPYVFCALAVFLRGDDRRVELAPMPAGAAIIAALAFVYALFAISGAGSDVVYWGFLLLLSGLPVYTWVVRRRPREARA